MASLNNRNPAETKKLFPFERLYPHNGQHPLYIKGELAADETRELINRTLTARVKISIQSKSVNADMMVWLALTPDAPAPKTV